MRESGRSKLLTAVLCMFMAVSASASSIIPPDNEIRLEFGLPGAELPDFLPVIPVNGRLETIAAAHMGGDRIVFVLSFDREVRKDWLDDSTLVFYLDADNDSATGRTGGHEGVDLMFMYSGGRFRTNRFTDAFSEENAPTRMAVQGRQIFFMVDAPLPEGDMPMLGYIDMRYPDEHSDRSARVSFELPRNDAAVESLPSREELELARRLAGAASFEPPDEKLRELFGLPAGELPELVPVISVGERLKTIAAAHMGGERVLFALRFDRPLEELPFDEFVLVFYLDADNDPATGRTDSHQGVDMQIGISGGNLTVQRPNPAYGTDSAVVRKGVMGEYLFFMLDAPLKTVDDKVIMRGYIAASYPDTAYEGSGRAVIELPRNNVEVKSLSARPAAVRQAAVREAPALGDVAPFAPPDGELRELFGLPAGELPELVPVISVGERLETIAAAHMGGERVLLAFRYSEELNINSFDGSNFLIYLDMDNDPATGRAGGHEGVDLTVLMDGWGLVGQGHRSVPRLMPQNPAYREAALRMNIQGRKLFMLIEAPIADVDGDIPLRLYLDNSYPDGAKESSPSDIIFKMKRNNLDLKEIPARETFASLRPSDFRMLSPVPYEALHNRGISRGAVQPEMKAEEIGRGRPGLTVETEGRRPGARGSVSMHEVNFLVKEDAGTARRGGAVTFGFPFPEGALFDPSRAIVVDVRGRPVQAQRTVTAFWPDDSIKWMRMDFTDDFRADEEKSYSVRFGSRVSMPRAGIRAPSAVEIREEGSSMFISTGPLKVELDRERFNIFRNVWAGGSGRPAASWGEEGIFLKDARGKMFSSSAVAPDSFKVEEKGPGRVVVRVEGSYGADDGSKFMKYITRLVFRAGSSVVEMEHSHINDYLEYAYSDFKSISMAAAPAGGVRKISGVFTDTEGVSVPLSGERLSLFQWCDESSEVEVDGRRHAGGKSPGVLKVEGGNGGFGIAVKDFWRRWPKGFRAEGARVMVDILPEQPGPEYGEDLPYHLIYPFVGGYYRMKWGMSFTERMVFDFSGAMEHEELEAAADRELIAVLPSEWYAQTDALGVMPVKRGDDFAAWDEYFEEAFERHMERQRHQREYGFMNYGDWQGERGRNWGNNEYDTAHAFFMQFARTGRREYFRAALAAARHQSDVDINHAHPDPFFVGGNKCHSIGHAGNPHFGLSGWSYEGWWRWSASNGHTWAEGMVEAWQLAGDSRSMEAAVMLGEHILWAVGDSAGGGDRGTGWLLRALMAVYRGTHDPVYLEHAEKLAREYVSVREEAYDASGNFMPEPGLFLRKVWYFGITGQHAWMQGLCLAAVKQVHKETGCPVLADALDRGVRFLADAWLRGGWSNDITGDAEPYPGPGARMSPGSAFTAEAISYWAAVTGDEELLRIAYEAAMGQAYLMNKTQARGQRLGQSLRSATAMLGWLQRAFDARDAGRKDILTGERDELASYLEGIPVADRYGVSGPAKTVFHLKLTGQEAGLSLDIRPHDGRGSGRIRIADAGGGTVHEKEFAVPEKGRMKEFSFKLNGSPGDEFVLEIEDDRSSAWPPPGSWDVRADGAWIVLEVVRDTQMLDLGLQRYYFFVPDDCAEFVIDYTAVYTMAYGAALFDSKGGAVEILQTENVWGPAIPPSPDETILRAHAAPEERGKLWSVVFWSNQMEYRFGFDDNIPPFVSLSAEEWFLPEAYNAAR